MGTGQMLLVLLAMILFSTILLTMYNNIDTQARIIERTKTHLQGQKIADRYFQKIETELVGDVFTFSEINSAYNGFSEDTTIGGITYHLNTERASYCGQTGNTPVATTDFQLIEFSIWTINAFQDSIVIGTPSNPLQKVFADMDI